MSRGAAWLAFAQAVGTVLVLIAVPGPWWREAAAVVGVNLVAAAHARWEP